MTSITPWSDVQIREIALEKALGTLVGSETAETIVGKAQTFYEFMIGGSSNKLGHEPKNPGDEPRTLAEAAEDLHRQGRLS